MWICFLINVCTSSFHEKKLGIHGPDSSDTHERLCILTLLSKISSVDTINSKSCVIPARAGWQIACYRSVLSLAAVQFLLDMQMGGLFLLLPAIPFFLTQDCDPLWSCMTQSVAGTLIELRSFQMCPSEREQGLRNEESLQGPSAY